MLGPAKRASTAAAPSAAATVITRPLHDFKEHQRVNTATNTCKHLNDAMLGSLPTIRPRHDLPEWIETDSLDGEVSRLVQVPASGNGEKSSSRRCCRNSTSSGYSSHSPPLSATSYNGGIGSANVAKSLAVIREGEIIPRPIWPSPSDSTGENSPDTASSDAEPVANGQQTSLYESAGYRSSSCEGSGASDYALTSSTSAVSAREVLLELSRTLSSVLEGDCGKTDEEILRDISRTVAQGQSVVEPKRNNSIYEDIYRNCSLSSSGKESTSSINVNPINSRLYGHRCYCERKSFLCQSHPSSSQQTTPKSDGRKEQCTPSIFLLSDEHTKSFFQPSEKIRTCNCRNYKDSCNTAQDNLSSKKNLGKQLRNQNDTRGEKEIRFNYPSIIEHEYTTLECSDESSSSEGVTDSSSKRNTWCKDFRGFDKNLDFTLDGLRAERLGRAIAKAKRRRQWCRVLTVILGLIFFVLSVVVVSLSVTRGRKVFGSM